MRSTGFVYLVETVGNSVQQGVIHATIVLKRRILYNVKWKKSTDENRQFWSILLKLFSLQPYDIITRCVIIWSKRANGVCPGKPEPPEI